ncbi:MAG: flavin reductase family protein [Bacteroidetes bacterium]|nr:MAG: flavin reductase family protein [Bacteroidota bacterium]
MLTINPKELPLPALQAYLSHSVAPRPVAFVSTIDRDGKPNLSPFSFFNLFSSNPPIAVFSPARSGKTNTVKHTHENVLEVPEAVINVVTYDMVHQTSLSSSEYTKGVNEFEKAGFTMLSSEMVKPPRVKESPIQMECKVKQVIELGQAAGAGNLVICEIILIHISESVLNEKKFIDQHKLDLVGRLGSNWYVRASGNALFEVAKPSFPLGIGVDAIPQRIRNSAVLTGNNLGQLGNVDKLPGAAEVRAYKKEFLKNVSGENEIHAIAKKLLDEGRVLEGWKVLLTTI